MLENLVITFRRQLAHSCAAFAPPCMQPATQPRQHQHELSLYDGVASGIDLGRLQLKLLRSLYVSRWGKFPS